MSSRRVIRGTTIAFALLFSAIAGANTITCESTDGNEKFCAVETRGGVTLDTQLSRAPCREGES